MLDGGAAEEGWNPAPAVTAAAVWQHGVATESPNASKVHGFFQTAYRTHCADDLSFGSGWTCVLPTHCVRRYHESKRHKLLDLVEVFASYVFRASCGPSVATPRLDGISDSGISSSR